jgi:D-alanine-D-alanine ligase
VTFLDDSGMWVLVACPAVEAGADPSTADVLEQAGLVEEGLEALGLPYRRVSVVDGRVWELGEALAPGAVVVNLLEAPPGAPQRHAAATAVLELLGVPFTGCGAGALWLTTDKLATRAVLDAAGIPVAAGGRWHPAAPQLPPGVQFPVILKPAWEDASVGLEGNPVCEGAAELAVRGAQLAARFERQPLLVEEFLPGREFNVSLLEQRQGPLVLPVAEIAFVDLPAGVPPIVGYEAKWEAGSLADLHTVRRFPEEREDGTLLYQLRDLAVAAWRECGLSGYARVDMRLDASGQPRVLEVNANPCLAADAGFMAAASRAGLDAAAVVRALLEAALRRPRGGQP